MHIDFWCSVTNLDDFFDVTIRLEKLLADQGRVIDWSKSIRNINNIEIDIIDGSMNVMDFLSKARGIGFPQDTIYVIDGNPKKLY